MALVVKYYNDTTHAVYTLDSDPTIFAWGQTNAALRAFLYRSDTGTLYIKTGEGTQDWTLVGPGSVVSPSDAMKRTLAASTVAAAQLNEGNATIVIALGDVGSVLGNVITGAGPHNNIAPDVNGVDPNTAGSPFFPLVWNGLVAGTLTGLVSADHSATGWTNAKASSSVFDGNGLCVIQNLSVSATLTCPANSASSAANNRFAEAITIPPLSSVIVMYTLATNKWSPITPTF